MSYSPYMQAPQPALPPEAYDPPDPLRRREFERMASEKWRLRIITERDDDGEIVYVDDTTSLAWAFWRAAIEQVLSRQTRRSRENAGEDSTPGSRPARLDDGAAWKDTP